MPDDDRRVSTGLIPECTRNVNTLCEIDSSSGANGLLKPNGASERYVSPGRGGDPTMFLHQDPVAIAAVVVTQIANR